MVNKRDAEVFIVYLSCHFDVGLFHVIGQEVLMWADTTQLGTPRGRYDEHSSTFSLSKKPRFIKPVGKSQYFKR
jgi:hypothetical protein